MMGAGSKCNKQQRTQLFLLSYTRSTNLAALTVSAKMANPPPTPDPRPVLPFVFGSCQPGGGTLLMPINQ